MVKGWCTGQYTEEAPGVASLGQALPALEMKAHFIKAESIKGETSEE
jgi:hypothetical protein